MNSYHWHAPWINPALVPEMRVLFTQGEFGNYALAYGETWTDRHYNWLGSNLTPLLARESRWSYNGRPTLVVLNEMAEQASRPLLSVRTNAWANNRAEIIVWVRQIMAATGGPLELDANMQFAKHWTARKRQTEGVMVMSRPRVSTPTSPMHLLTRVNWAQRDWYGTTEPIVHVRNIFKKEVA